MVRLANPRWYVLAVALLSVTAWTAHQPAVAAAPPPGSQGPGGEQLPDQQDFFGGFMPAFAEVDSTAMAAHIECAWALPDVGDDIATGIQYGDDDDPALEPTPAFPCDVPEDHCPCDPDGGKPEQADGARNLIQVLPNTHDLPSEKAVQLWAAVDHPAGVAEIDDVYWKVFHADGSPKVQVHGSAVPVSACASHTAMFAAANETGQVSSAAINDPQRGMIALCQEQVKRFYSAAFTISKHQPCGEYRVETHTVSNGVEGPVKTTYIDVLCFFDLNVDFTSIDFAQVVPGSTKVVAGNTLFQLDDGRPSVQNRGNTGMGVGIEYAPLVQQGQPLPKVITGFDACFGRSAATLQCQDPIVADPTSSSDRFDFDASRERTLCANEIGKLDLSVHPQAGLPNGSYAGTVSIYGFHQPHLDCPAFLPNVQQPG